MPMTPGVQYALAKARMTRSINAGNDPKPADQRLVERWEAKQGQTKAKPGPKPQGGRTQRSQGGGGKAAGGSLTQAVESIEQGAEVALAKQRIIQGLAGAAPLDDRDWDTVAHGRHKGE